MGTLRLVGLSTRSMEPEHDWHRVRDVLYDRMCDDRTPFVPACCERQHLALRQHWLAERDVFRALVFVTSSRLYIAFQLPPLEERRVGAVAHGLEASLP